MYPRLQFHTSALKIIIDNKQLNFYYILLYPLKEIILNAGLYKPSQFFLQYHIMLANLAGKPPTFSYQTHGKRRRQTVSINAHIHNLNL